MISKVFAYMIVIVRQCDDDLLSQEKRTKCLEYILTFNVFAF